MGILCRGQTISVKGTKTVVRTNEEGKYILSNVDNNAIIEISYIGFQSQTVEVRNRRNISLLLKRE